MSTYGVPVVSDSDPSAYYSWQERPECHVLLNQPCTPVPLQPTQTAVNNQRSNGIQQDSVSGPTVDAKNALEHIAKGTAKGDICALTFRWWLQTRLFNLGCIIECHRWTVIVVGCIVLGLCCLGLKTVRLETNVERLWVQDSGRIAQELNYTRKMLGERSYASSYEVLLQTGKNLLDPAALEEHLRLVSIARNIKVRVGTREWSYEKICQKIALRDYGGHAFRRALRQMTPCLIITPLDCFWDGAKTLGPNTPIQLPPTWMAQKQITWKNFNPEELITKLNVDRSQAIINDFREMGILNGYQNRPCLHPKSKQCPTTAANKDQMKADVGAILRGGCPGFASKLMHWPESLVVGGVEVNDNRLTRIQALQSLLVLRSPRALYNEIRNEGPHYEWTLEQAKHIIKAWQEKLRESVADMDRKAQAASKTPGAPSSSAEHFYAYTESSLNDLLAGITRHVNPVTLGGGAFLMALYLTVCFVRWKEPISSHTWVALASFLISCLTVVAGLGASAVLGLSFNVLTVKVLPFLLLGIAMDDCLRVTARFGQIVSNISGVENYKLCIGETMKSAGPSQLLSSLCNIVAVLTGAIIPVPVMQTFCLQAGLVGCFQLLNSLLLLPALLSLDLQRRRGYKVDCLCCLTSRPENPLTLAGSPPSGAVSRPSSNKWRRRLRLLTPRTLIRHGLVSALRLVPVKAMVVGMAVIAIGSSAYGALRFNYGLDFASVVPRGTPEHSFITAHHRLLGVYNFFMSTRADFQYDKDQMLLRRYYEALRRIPHVMEATIEPNRSGLSTTPSGLWMPASESRGPETPPVFWLDSLRNWLLTLQRAFDKNVRERRINSNSGHWYQNATIDGRIGFRLLVQTGKDDAPINYDRLHNGRLVNNLGIIDPDAFYVYLTAWRSLRTPEYEALRNLLRPEPVMVYMAVRDFIQNPLSKYLSIEKSPQLEFTQMNFYLKNVQDSASMLQVVKAIREVSDKFNAVGLPNYPTGVPFVYFEQYFLLPRALGFAIGACFICISVLLGIFFFNAWMVFLGISLLFLTLAELCGLCSLLGFHLNGASAAVLLACVGLFARHQTLLLWTFLTGRGTRQRRMERALKHHGPPVFNATFGILLALAVLAISPLDFIVVNFFRIISLAVLLSLFNTLILLPAVLDLIGPPSQFRPTKGWVDSSSALHVCPPPADNGDGSPRNDSLLRPSHHSLARSRPLSLSTISEEPSRLSSSSSLDTVPPPPPPPPPRVPPTRPSVLMMEPEIVLRTSTGRGTPSVGSPARPGTAVPVGPKQICCHDSPTNQVTTVKATAKFKVEVHSPSPLTNASNLSSFNTSPCGDNCSSSSSSSSSCSSNGCSVVYDCGGHPKTPSSELPMSSVKRHHQSERSKQHYSTPVQPPQPTLPPQFHPNYSQHIPKHHRHHQHHHRRQVFSHLHRRDHTTDIDYESGIDTCEE